LTWGKAISLVAVRWLRFAGCSLRFGLCYTFKRRRRKLITEFPHNIARRFTDGFMRSFRLFAPWALLFFLTFAPLAQSPVRADEEGDSHSQVTDEPEALPVDLGAIKRLKVAGKAIEETPLRVGNLDVLAPIVAELPSLGATATRAADANIPDLSELPEKDRPARNQFFQLNFPEETETPPLVFAVGRSVAYIKKESYALRAAPLVVKGQLWLPIFSLAPLLGAAPRLDASGTLHFNPTVQSVELFEVKGVMAVTIKTSAPLPEGRAPLMGTLDDPPKIYFDFPGFSMGLDAGYTTAERVTTGGLREVQQARVGLFQGFPDTTRVVLDLDQKLNATLQPLPDKTITAFLLVNPNPRAVADPTPPPSRDPNSPLRGVKIVVDAGHGGHDAGAGGKRSKEKDHTLDIARRVRNHLINKGATVSMTREDDRFISLQGRVDFAHRRNADIFFSVHINSYSSTSAGTETYYYTGQSKALASEVQRELVKATGLPNRGVRSARFFVIRKTRMPSILTETAFISNPREEALLMDPKFRERVAQAMVRGIENYARKYR
jgi:N-acetylmuramoyl-L-alanine amidase